MDLKELRLKLKAGWWDRAREGLYPRPYLWEYVEATHPEIIEEYKNWFDKEVRK